MSRIRIPQTTYILGAELTGEEISRLQEMIGRALAEGAGRDWDHEAAADVRAYTRRLGCQWDFDGWDHAYTSVAGLALPDDSWDH